MPKNTDTSTPGCPNCARLERKVSDLEARIAKLEKANEDLRRGQKRQAAPFSKGDPKREPKKPGRKPGEAYGAKAHRAPPAEVDETYDALLPCACPYCNGEVEEEEVKEQFQVEVPRKPIRRKFNVHVGRCRRCRRRVQGRHPLQTSDALGAAASQLGPDAQSLATHMNKDLGLSHGKVARFFETAFGIELSRGGSAQIILRAARRCKQAFGEILVVVRRSAWVVPDETGWRVAGLLQWLHVFVTEQATLYLIRPGRGFEVAEEALGAEYAGRLTHDGWSPYDRFGFATHQQCMGHILSRCGKMLEAAVGGAVRFPRAVKGLVQDTMSLRDRRDAGEVSPHGLAVATGRLESRMDRLLEWHKTDPANERLAKHLFKHRDQLLTFLREPGMDATNWRAEQAIRPAVVNRKVWGGNRTPAGAPAQERLVSVLRTCVQQGKDAIAFLSDTLRAPPGREPALLPMPPPC
jgi:transposase